MFQAGSTGFAEREDGVVRLALASRNAVAAAMVVAGLANINPHAAEAAQPAASQPAPPSAVSSGFARRARTSAIGVGETLSVTHLAGSNGGRASDDGPGTSARFSFPEGVAVDAAGNVYVADTYNNTVRKISPSGMVTTLAGLAENVFSVSNRDGTGAEARFFRPTDVVVDDGGTVYAASPNAIRKITRAGVVTTLMSSDSRILSIAIDGMRNLYISDGIHNVIQKLTPSGIVSTLAGLRDASGSSDGAGSAARFNEPHGMAVDAGGNVYVADGQNHTIRRITAGGEVTTIAGMAGTSGDVDGPAASALFYSPAYVALGSDGSVYVTDSMSGNIRRIAGGVVTRVAVKGYYPAGIAMDSAGALYVADMSNHAIRKIVDGTVTPLAGKPAEAGLMDGSGSSARFNAPTAMAIDGSGNVYVAHHDDCTIRKVTPAGMVTTVAGACGAALATDNAGDLYVADSATIRKILPGGGVTIFAGSGRLGTADGHGTTAEFNHPFALATDSAGNVYVADTNNDTIRKITPAGDVTTIAGAAGVIGSSDGMGAAARFDHPGGIAVDSAGTVFVADTNNSTIRAIAPSGLVSTFAGVATGSSYDALDGLGGDARFYKPEGLAFDGAGNLLVADVYDYAIRKVTPAGVVSTLAGASPLGRWYGSGLPGSSDGIGLAANFDGLSGVAANRSGNVYIADSSNQAIRVGRPVLADAATIDATTGPLSVPRQLDTSAHNATSWQWSVIRRPVDSTALLSSDSIPNPTFTPDVTGLFRVRLTATDGTKSSVTTVDLDARPGCSASLTITAPASVLPASSGNVASVADTPGVSYDWTITNGIITAGQGTSSIVFAACGSESVSVGVSACGVAAISTIVPVDTIAISAPTSLCSNATAVASTTVVPGAQYLWNISNGTITAGQETPSINFTGGGSGASYLWVSVSSPACGSVYASPTVSSITIPIVSYPDSLAIAAPSAICANGSAVSVTADAIPGSTYLWTIGNGTITSGQGTNTVSFRPAGSGSAFLTVVASNHTCSAKGSIAIPFTAAPVASITGPVSSCAGNTVTLDAGAGFASYLWSTGATTQSISVSTPATTTYTVTVATAGGCTALASHTVTVNPLQPPSIITTINDGQAVLIGATSLSPASWSWRRDGLPVGTAPSIVTSVAGSYTVTITDANGCPSTSAASAVGFVAAGGVVADGVYVSDQDFATGTLITVDKLSDTAAPLPTGYFALLGPDGSPAIAYEVNATSTPSGMFEIRFDVPPSLAPDFATLNSFRLLHGEIDGSGQLVLVDRTTGVQFSDSPVTRIVIGWVPSLGPFIIARIYGTTVSSPEGLSSPILATSSVSATATFTDPTFADPTAGDRFTAQWNWGDGTTTEGTVTPPIKFSDGTAAQGSVGGTHIYARAGVYSVTLTVSDNTARGGATARSFHYAVVYDPEGGNATGGGWVDSPAGALRSAAAATGKATFDFQANYKKGSTKPEGHLQFQFNDLRFIATSFDSMVVADATAQLRGHGTISGAECDFILTVVDGGPGAAGATDKLRLKISSHRGRVIYDNVVDRSASDDLTNAKPQPIVGGSITVHKP